MQELNSERNCRRILNVGLCIRIVVSLFCSNVRSAKLNGLEAVYIHTKINNFNITNERAWKLRALRYAFLP